MINQERVTQKVTLFLLSYNTVRMTSETPPTIVGPSLCGRNGFLMSSRHDYQ